MITQGNHKDTHWHAATIITSNHMQLANKEHESCQLKYSCTHGVDLPYKFYRMELVIHTLMNNDTCVNLIELML